MLCLPAALMAQNISKTDRATVETILNKYATGVQTGRIKVDSAAVDGDTLRLFASNNLTYLPLRSGNYSQIISDVKAALPQNVAGKAVSIVAGGRDIKELILRASITGKGRREAFTNPAKTPLVTDVDRPFKSPRGLDGRHIALWQSHGLYYQHGLARWEWQRGRMFQSVEDKYTQSYVLPYLIPMLQNAGAVVMTPRERDTNPYEVVVDNDAQSPITDADGNITADKSTYAEANGQRQWRKGEGHGFAYLRPFYKDFENPFAEGSYRVADAVAKKSQESTVTWTPDIPADRDYAVYVSYKTLPNSASDAHYTIHHKGGTTEFAVNQKMGGGTWIYLGTFSFAKGKGGKVVLSNVSKDKNACVTADAVRFGGGLGNIARCADGDSIWANTKKDRDTPAAPRSQWQPRISTQYETSGYPRYLEGARYWMQWAGIPDSIYSPTHGANDYSDDYKDRGIWVNYLAGGTKAVPDMQGLNIPIDMSLAFHSDAGTVYGDSIIGTLGIYQTSQYGGKFADGTSRDANRDLCDLVLSSITDDVRALYEPKWTRRGMWNQRYFEAWVPRVPAMLLELLSHENFADMRYGLDPRFHFTVGRAVYKGILRFLADEYGYDYVVQPLPVSHMAAAIDTKQRVRLTWKPVSDPLEPTAEAERYVVYKRVGDGGFDNGTVVKRAEYVCDIPSDEVVSFKVTAINQGGESFPSEIISVGLSSKSASKPILVVNGFDRISAPDDFRSVDDEQAGFLADSDNGVPYKQMISYVGKMKEFRRAIPWTDDDSSGFGDSYGNCERLCVAGNTFDYPALHGKAIMRAGHSFISMSKAAFEESDVLTTDAFAALDLILGKEKQSKMGRMGAVKGIDFKTFTQPMQDAITAYCKAGGRVFVSGAYVATDIFHSHLVKAEKSDMDFARGILKYTWRDDKAAVEGKIKSVPSPLADTRADYEYYNEPNEESYVVESPDAISPADPCAYTAFRYTESNLPAGIVFGGNDTDHWRTVVLGFPFESVKGEAQRDSLMSQVLHYLLK